MQTQIGQTLIQIGRLLQDPAVQAQIGNGVPLADLIRQNQQIQDLLIVNENQIQDLPIVNENQIQDVQIENDNLMMIRRPPN